jgi:tetratricopeptide (TPR) repeat protein
MSRGAAYGRKGEYDQEIADETKAIELNPQLVWAYAHRGDAYGYKGSYDQAIADETKAIELNPKLAEAYMCRGGAHGRKGNYDQEIADETKAIELNPKLAVAYNNRGLAYGKGKGDYDHAIADYDKAIELNPKLAVVYNNRGFAYESKGNYDQAIADETKAIELNPKLGLAYAHRGDAYVGKGDPAKALIDFRAAAPLIPASDQRHDKALAQVADLEKQLAAPAPTPRVAIAGRAALVIGNSAYRNVPSLNNPANDASLIATALKTDGFDVTVADNLDRDDLIDALKDFAAKADAADWAVVYFAGHGIEMGGTNYLIPVDAKLATDRDVGFEAIPIDQVMSAIDGAHQLRVVILDACRNNPFAERMRRGTGTGVFREVGRGLARIEPTQGTVIVYSARPGQVAADGAGDDSPFAIALAHHLTEPGVEVLKLFRLVRDDVLGATGNGQEVFQDSSLPGKDFFFRPQ